MVYLLSELRAAVIHPKTCVKGLNLQIAYCKGD